MTSRRQFITGVATASTVAIAGCSSAPLMGGGPEAAAEQLLTAFQSGDVESANEALHPEAHEYPIEEDELGNGGDFTVKNANQVSTREAVEADESGDEPSDEEVEEAETFAENVVHDMGVDDYAWVLVTIEEDGDEEEKLLLTVEDDGDWYVLGL